MSDEVVSHEATALVLALLEYLATLEPEDEVYKPEGDPDDFGEVYWNGSRFVPFPGRED